MNEKIYSQRVIDWPDGQYVVSECSPLKSPGDTIIKEGYTCWRIWNLKVHKLNSRDVEFNLTKWVKTSDL